ncbi:MAG: hypothetical protein UZ14_CFX002000830 [Chloroflexi bacterium OLB14]|nr:MAG: hypothetical protein UZ14_CFX002000830 [Chloroflexi bacterium OLB14]
MKIFIMVTKKSKPKNKTSKKITVNEVEFSVKAGTKTTFTVEAGAEKDGKVPIRILVEEDKKNISNLKQVKSKIKNWLRNPFIQKILKSPFIQRYSLAMWLFFGALFVYLLTRLIGLSHFPIYFFVDEALQSQFAEDLIKYNFRDVYGVFLPPAFHNNEYFTLGMGVYLQVIPYLLFGKSAIVTRATSAIISVIAAISVGILLRDAVKIKYWWVGVLFLSITPTWFLHSRTAWEMTEFTAFYIGALWAYTFYRIKSPNYLYLAVIFSALGFYTYSPGQILVPITTFALFIFDLKYHWQNRRTVSLAILLLALLTIQYFRFRALDPNNAIEHLHNLGSYLLANISVWEKIKIFFSQYFYGLSPWYWYSPNLNQLSRHLMKDYGQIMLWTLPFALLGLVETIRRVREPVFRIILTGFLVAPTATAFVAVGISRTMCFVSIAAILTAIGFNKVLTFLENPSERLTSWMQLSTSRVKILLAINIFVFPSLFALRFEKALDKIALIFLAFIIALYISGYLSVIARHIVKYIKLKKRKKTSNSVAWIVFIALSGINIFMLNDALRNGPTWYTDYNLHGMQYGAFQVFEPIKQYIKEHPNTQVFFSPTWTNGADIIMRFFLGDDTPVKFHSIIGYIENNLPIEDDSLFIMTKEEYNFAIQSEKLADFQIEKTIPCPDGTNCFYFVRLRYSDAAQEIFAQEKALREKMQESIVKIDNEDVKIRHTYIEADDQHLGIQLLFDNDPYTFAKTYEANPFVIELTFPTPRTINGFSIIIGSTSTRITLTGYTAPNADPITYEFSGEGSIEVPQLNFELPEPMTVTILHIEQLDLYAVEPTKNHIWEITFR